MNASDITWDTMRVMQEVKVKFPEYAMVINSLKVRVSKRTTTSIGICRFRGKVPFEIVMSFKAWQHEANRDEMRDTILHEIAHAIAGFDAQHGPAWQAVARKIGAKPVSVCNSLPVMPIAYYSIQCYVCKGPMNVTKRQLTKAQRGGALYRHTNCKPLTTSLGF